MALSLGWKLAFLTEQTPMPPGSGASDLWTHSRGGGQEQRQGGRTHQQTWSHHCIIGCWASSFLPSLLTVSADKALARKTSKPFARSSRTAKALG